MIKEISPGNLDLALTSGWCIYACMLILFVLTVSKTPSKFDKVVKREVCRITTKGTQTFNFLSGECADSKSTYLLALSEKVKLFRNNAMLYYIRIQE